jgi:2'-5' RNA ligase
VPVGDGHTGDVDEPLVVTLAVEEAVQSRWDRERAQLFPSGRTRVGAHVTLFHAVPGDLLDQVLADLDTVAGPAFPVSVSGVMGLGRGAAYRLESAELVRRHHVVQQRWWSRLSAQDRQGFRPHVTVQNKVSPDVARATVERLQQQFAPYEVMALGVEVWRYVGGPWEPVTTVPFARSGSVVQGRRCTILPDEATSDRT